jgi:vacuolar-type H+-ATPase subunit I/STV1
LGADILRHGWPGYAISDAMSADDRSLPDDMDQLTSMIRAMAAQAARADALEREIETLKSRNADADERIKRLMQILKAYDRARFGQRPEKLSSAAADDEGAQQASLFGEIETGMSALRAQVGTGRPAPRLSHARTLRGIWSASKWYDRA